MRLTLTDREYSTLMNALSVAASRFDEDAKIMLNELPPMSGLAVQFETQAKDTRTLYAKLDQQGDDQDPTNCLADAVNQAETIASLHPQLRVTIKPADYSAQGEVGKLPTYDEKQTAHVEQLQRLLDRLALDAHAAERLGPGAGDPLMDALNAVHNSLGRAIAGAKLVSEDRVDDPIVPERSR